MLKTDTIFSATFDYFGNLPELLKRNYRELPFTYRFKEHPGVKDAIETMGVPHTEVDMILANGRSVAFNYQLQHKDLLEVYPLGHDVKAKTCLHLTPARPSPARFILDVHLGKLARRLRLLGIDSDYRNDFPDAEIMQRAFAEHRIILTRDRGILKHRKVTHGYLVRSDHVDVQLGEVMQRFQLVEEVQPWSRCMACNGKLEDVEKQVVLDRLEPKTRRYYDEFRRCTKCDQIYWQGSHFKKIKGWLARADLAF